MKPVGETFGAILSSRKVWVALGGLALVICTAVGAPAEKVTPIITAITALAGVVIGSIAYEDGANATATSADPTATTPTPTAQPTPTPLNGQASKLLAMLLSLGVAAALAGSGVGCVAQTTSGATTQPILTPQQQALQNVDRAINAYNLVLVGINTAESAGLIPPSKVKEFQPVLDAVASALASAQSDAAAGNISAGQTAFDALNAALGKLGPLLTQINSAKAAAAKPAAATPAAPPPPPAPASDARPVRPAAIPSPFEDGFAVPVAQLQA